MLHVDINTATSSQYIHLTDRRIVADVAESGSHLDTTGAAAAALDEDADDMSVTHADRVRCSVSGPSVGEQLSPSRPEIDQLLQRARTVDSVDRRTSVGPRTPASVCECNKT